MTRFMVRRPFKNDRHPSVKGLFPGPRTLLSMSPTSFFIWCLLLARLVSAAYVYPNGSRLDQIRSMYAWEGFVYDIEVPSQGFNSKLPANSTSCDLCLCSHARPRTR